MSAPTKNVYGTPGDTSFRKKYDREEYAAKAAAREQEHKDQKDHKLFLGKHRREPTPPPDALTTARANRLNLEENLNKTTLVPAGAGVGKRGKGAGFYCDACDLTFKDSLQWVDHLNSKQHLYATGQTGEVKRASLEEVKRRLEWLRAKKAQEEKDKAEGVGVDLKKRLEERKRLEEEERREKREKRKEKQKAAKMKRGEGVKDSVMTDAGTDGAENIDADAIAMARMMGFTGGFGTTKKG